VPNGALIRIEHCVTKCNLHSHYERSAVTKQLEVSCYGTGGRGDANDDWRLLLEATDELAGRVRLQHALTAPRPAPSSPGTSAAISSAGDVSHCLHSHHQYYPSWGLWHLEVTNYDAPTDAHDVWILQSEQLIPLSEVVMNRVRVAFDAADATAGAVQRLWRGLQFEYTSATGDDAPPVSVGAASLPPDLPVVPSRLTPAAQRIVVTMGTEPTRDCTAAVASLLRQTRVPDLVYVATPVYSAWAQQPARIPPRLRAVGAPRLTQCPHLYCVHAQCPLTARHGVHCTGGRRAAPPAAAAP
jgi:hypothetical protein